ncbi:MAG: DUF4124 domain-containing protein [Archangiaceae bacterium]|nr:DUF4124 domain-containing protein [Archangiaceae bacterium]
MMRRIGGNMRSLIVLFSLVASTALAQYDNGGVWTGYVGGWKPNAQPQTLQLGATGRPNPMLDWPRRQPQRVVVMPYYVPVNTTSVNQESQRAAEQAEQRRAWEAEQARIAQQNQLENERRLAADREAMLQQQLESERRLAAEREALAAEKLRLEREAAARTLAAMTPPPVQQPEPVRPSVPQTPGNDIYRWVDADGVTHYSTNVPASAKASATKVGGSR